MHRRSSIARSPLALLVLLLLGAGCSRSAPPESETIYRAESVVTVTIVNRSMLDAIVYVLHGGVRDRLGTVTAATTTSYQLRSSSLGATGDFALVADPVGSNRTATTEPLRVTMGSTFTWTLETDFTRGSLLVR